MNGSSAPKGSGRGTSVEYGTGIQDWAEGAWKLSTTFSSRLRPALGECLARLAAAMPVAFLEPQLNEYNACSVYTTKSPRERASKWGGAGAAGKGCLPPTQGPRRPIVKVVGSSLGPEVLRIPQFAGASDWGTPELMGTPVCGMDTEVGA